MPPETAADLVAAPAASAPAVRAVTCPSCGGTVTLRAAGYTVTVVCLYCGSHLDVAHPEVKLIAQYRQAAGSLIIPLGSRGVLKGVEWEAIGYLERSDTGGFRWSEFLLFNPYHGYRWLITDGRGWSLGRLITQRPSVSASFARHGRDHYERFFDDGRAQVDYVLGEFYWRVSVGEEVQTADWVRPGFMLSRECNASEESWTLSELLKPREMRAAFGVPPPYDPWPPLPHQPSPFAGDAGFLTKVGLGTVALLLVLFVLLSHGPKLAEATLYVPLSAGEERTATLGPVTLTRPWQAVSIAADAPGLDNRWVDLDYALVNRATQQSYEAYAVAERYSGRDYDGAWTEGSGRSLVKIAAVPAGAYDLVVSYSTTRWAEPYWSGAGPGTEAPQQVNVQLWSESMFGANLLLALMLIVVPLIWMAYRHLKFEQARQDQSDFGRTGIAKVFSGSEED
ncbi:MAG TPA: DUF4178 domain-containing protein [Allosphingosinicella sp.]|jgi:hypothetical protein